MAVSSPGSANPWVAAAVAAGLALVVLFLCQVRRRHRRRAQEESQAQSARRDAAVRILWAASSDFLAAGWGRSDLERLRLLAMNVAPGQVLGPRIAERLRAATSAVLSGVLDRLADVAATAREVEIEPRVVGRLEISIQILAAELEGVSCRPGSMVMFRPDVVAMAAASAVDACSKLREFLKPSMVSDPAEVVRWLTGTRHRERTAAGELVADLSGLGPGARVAARPLDLAHAMDEMLARVFASGDACGPVTLVCAGGGDDVTLALVWTPRDRQHIDRRSLTESMRVLSAYGVRLALCDAAQSDGIRLETAFPAVDADTATGGVSRADAS
jgi:hypothetical protein